MAITESRRPVQPGEPAPEFALPAAHGEGFVSLADYRGRSPVLLALYRGLYCPFCRRHVVQLGTTAEKLRETGVQTLAVVGTNAERARVYFRFRPPRFPLGADPDLNTHRAYGLPNTTLTPDIWQVVESKLGHLARELQLEVPAGDAHHAINRLDGFEPTDSDTAEARQQRAQFAGQFLVDRDGIVRWANVECAREGLAGLEKFPTEEELLAEARAL